MKELGIATTVYLTIDGNKRWVGDDNKYVRDCFVAAILERACREWLDKHDLAVLFMNDDWYSLIRFGAGSVGSYDSFDAAQIAALEYCLKENSSGKES